MSIWIYSQFWSIHYIQKGPGETSLSSCNCIKSHILNGSMVNIHIGPAFHSDKINIMNSSIVLLHQQYIARYIKWEVIKSELWIVNYSLKCMIIILLFSPQKASSSIH